MIIGDKMNVESASQPSPEIFPRDLSRFLAQRSASQVIVYVYNIEYVYKNQSILVRIGRDTPSRRKGGLDDVLGHVTDSLLVSFVQLITRFWICGAKLGCFCIIRRSADNK